MGVRPRIASALRRLANRISPAAPSRPVGIDSAAFMQDFVRQVVQTERDKDTRDMRTFSYENRHNHRNHVHAAVFIGPRELRDIAKVERETNPDA